VCPDNKLRSREIANSRKSKSGSVWQRHFVTWRQYFGPCLWMSLKFNPQAGNSQILACNFEVPARYHDIVYRQRAIVRQIENSSHWAGGLQ
jgi:hypothetical protein